MAKSGFTRVPQTTNRLVPLVHAVILKVPGVRAVIRTPHFEFMHERHEQKPIGPEDGGVPYYLETDRYLIAAETIIFVEGAPANGRTLELKLVATRTDGSDPGWGNLWHIDAWWHGVYTTEKPGKATWSCWENEWGAMLPRDVKNQPNLPPSPLSFFKVQQKRRVA